MFHFIIYLLIINMNIDEINQNILNKYNIGTHTTKLYKNFYETLHIYYKKNNYNFKKPVQIFSGSSKFWNRPKIDPNDFKKTKNYIKKNKIKVFVHSLYLLNLCKNFNENEKILKYLKWEFEMGKQFGFKGIILHLGNICKLSPCEALNNMYKNILQILDIISIQCPLILETCAGQGTEICWEFDALKNFYNSFNNNQKKKIKICIDTCHVFSAGYYPFDFIKKWYKLFPSSLKLIHLNDSKVKIGAKKDRHAFPGRGEIGNIEMFKIIKFCYKNNIKMIIE